MKRQKPDKLFIDTILSQNKSYAIKDILGCIKQDKITIEEFIEYAYDKYHSVFVK